MVQPAAPPARVVLRVAYRTDPGLDPDKQVNEDACAARDLPLGHLMVVCDGMGGHAGGKEASGRAVQIVFGYVKAAPHGSSPAAVLKAAVEHAGQLVFQLGGPASNLLRPGSTVVALLSHVGGTEVAHVGDSRAYLLRAGQIHPLTRDHSMVQQMVDAGLLKPEDAIRHPDANKITRALGMTAAPDVELRPAPVVHLKDDIFLLATDGLCDLVMPAEMLSVVMHARQTRGLEFACEQLVSLANARGGHDNITVMLGEVTDAPQCPQQQRTMVAAGPARSAERPPMTLPESPVASAVAPAEVTVVQGAGIQKTMLDDASSGAGSPVSGSAAPSARALAGVSADRLALPPPTWAPGGTGPAAGRGDDWLGSRRLLWLGTGLALVLLGVAMVVLSLWWALSGVTFLPQVEGSLAVRTDAGSTRVERPRARPACHGGAHATTLDVRRRASGSTNRLVL